MKKINILIIGFGRFGALLANILKPFGRIHIISSQEINNNNFIQVEYDAVSEMDWIIPSVPISKMPEVLKKIKPFLKKGSLVMDVCSVKVMPAKWMKQILPRNVEILATHPMFGPDSAMNGIKGLQMVICPVRIQPKTLKKIIDIFKKLQLQIIKTTPVDHDKQTAISLALVHFIGRGLGIFGLNKQKISTLGFERLLTVNETVNNDSYELFLDMHKFNPYTKSIRRKFIKALKTINNKL